MDHVTLTTPLLGVFYRAWSGTAVPTIFTTWSHKNYVTSLNIQYQFQNKDISKPEYGPMPNLMVAVPNIDGALCSTPQSLTRAHCSSAVQ